MVTAVNLLQVQLRQIYVQRPCPKVRHFSLYPFIFYLGWHLLSMENIKYQKWHTPHNHIEPYSLNHYYTFRDVNHQQLLKNKRITHLNHALFVSASVRTVSCFSFRTWSGTKWGRRLASPTIEPCFSFLNSITISHREAYIIFSQKLSEI